MLDRDQTTYGTTIISYQIERRCRKTLAIEVHPDGSVLIKAPEDVSMDAIKARVTKRGGWILKQQRTFASYPPPLPQRQFVSGESYRYLGRQYRLKVIESENERVRLWRGRLEVSTPESTNTKQVARLLVRWFRERAQAVFTERYEGCTQVARQHGIQHDKGFELLRMPKRWGSCTKDGRLLLNPALVSASKDSIDYVILHELCHTVIHNHSPEFYALLFKVVPDWQERQRVLNRATEVVDL